MPKEKDYKKQTRVLAVAIGILILTIIGISYAWLMLIVKGDQGITMTVEYFKVTFEEKDGINLVDAYPLGDSMGLDSDGYAFSVKNEGLVKASYKIYLDDTELEAGESRIPDDFLKYTLTKNGTESSPAILTNRLLSTNTLEGLKTDKYLLKMWLTSDKDGDGYGKVFRGKIRIVATEI